MQCVKIGTQSIREQSEAKEGLAVAESHLKRTKTAAWDSSLEGEGGHKGCP
jgi:hypothetical protein